MSVEDELNALRGYVQFEQDEVLLTVEYGTVNGPGINGREGILFATQFRVGVSVAPGWSDGAFYVMPFTQVGRAELSGVSCIVHGLRGVTLSVAPYATDTLGEAVGSIEFRRTQFVREDLRVNFERIGTLLEQGDHRAAAQAARRVLGQQHACIPALALAGIAAQRAEEWTSAAQFFAQALDTGADDPNSFREELAFCYLQLNQFDEVVELATSVLDLEKRAVSYRLRAFARWHTNEIEGALSDCMRAAEVDPSDLQTWTLLARIAAQVDNVAVLNRALDALRRLEARAMVELFEPSLLVLQGRHADALRAAGRAVKAFPEDRLPAIVLLEASLASDIHAGMDWLPVLDKNFWNDPYYQLLASVLLITGQRAQEAWARAQTIDLAGALPGLRECVATIKAAALCERSDFLGALDVLHPMLRGDKAWIDSEKTRGFWFMACFFGGKALVELKRFDEALPFLTDAENAPKTDSEPDWSTQELAALVERANTGCGRNSYLGDNGGSARGMYEVLGVVASELERSGRLKQIATRVRTFCSQYDEPPLVAVVGEYSVGKSTFINALVRRQLLPTGEGVTTGTIVVLQFGEQERMRAVFQDGRVVESDSLKSVEEFVRETGSNEQRRGLHHVDVFIRADVLKQIKIVDSPGLNAPFPEHKKITERFLTESDAVLFLFNVEAAGRSVEGEFLAQLREHSRKAVAVVNQIDLVTPADAREVIDGIKNDFPGSFLEVHGVSAKRAFDATRANDAAQFEKSGLPALEHWLESNVLANAREIKAQAARSKVREALRDVSEARAEFDAIVDRDGAAIIHERKAVADWIQSELQATIESATILLRKRIDAAIAELIANIARRSTPDATAPLAVIDPMARSFHANCVAAYRDYAQTVATVYDGRVAPLREALARIEGPEWRGVLASSLTELQIQFAAWRKDLYDYIEQVVAFADGFVEARGIGVTLYQEVPPGRANDPQLFGSALRPRLAFLVERAESLTTRWTAELKHNTDESLTKFERELRAEAGGIREESFRRVERLQALLGA